MLLPQIKERPNKCNQRDAITAITAEDTAQNSFIVSPIFTLAILIFKFGWLILIVDILILHVQIKNKTILLKFDAIIGQQHILNLDEPQTKSNNVSC